MARVKSCRNTALCCSDKGVVLAGGGGGLTKPFQALPSLTSQLPLVKRSPNAQGFAYRKRN